MTTINIGTSSGNITNVKIDKPYDEIKFSDIREIVNERFGVFPDSIYGWAEVNPKNKKK